MAYKHKHFFHPSPTKGVCDGEYCTASSTYSIYRERYYELCQDCYEHIIRRETVESMLEQHTDGVQTKKFVGEYYSGNTSRDESY